MSDNGYQKVGRPDAGVDAGFLFMQYCGGSGAGGCLFPLGVTHAEIFFRMPRFIVRNKRIVFENKEFTGVRIYNNGGAAGLCANSLGVEQGFWMALSADGQLTEDEVKTKGKFITGALPYDIEFLAKDIPQPVGGDWLGYIVVQLVWASPLYLNEGGGIPNQNSMRIKKHEYDIQL